MKKLPLFGLLLAAALIGLSSCTMAAKPLEGTWTVDSTENTAGARVLGDGTVTLSFSGEFLGIEVYTGTGTFSGGIFDYLATASYWPGFGATISLYELGEDPDTDSIDLTDNAYSGGASLSGDYTGWGVYSSGDTKDIGDGTFTATR